MVGVRYSASTDFAALDRLERMAEQYPYLVQEEVFDTAIDENDRIIAAMRQTPPKVTGPRDWQTSLQQRAYFASGGFGRGIPSVRTGEMNDAYELGFNVEKGSVSVVMRNTSDHYRFVVGSLRMDGPDTQQRMFAQGGYKLVAPIAEDQGVRLRIKLAANLKRIPREFV